MTAVTTVASGIAFGAYDVAIAGGVEHMGHHPMGQGIDPNPRFVADKLVDPSALVMGTTAENLHDRFPALTKERADAYAAASQHKLAKAYADGKIQPDLVPGRDPLGRARAGGWRPRTSRRGPAPRWRRWPTLKTPFRPHGRITAGNAAGLNDGATACLRRRRRRRRRARPAGEDAAGRLRLRRRRPRGDGRRPDPGDREGAAPTGLSIDDIGLFEINEAFAVQVLAFLDHYGIADDDPRVNPYGGAIAVGHPLASSGVRLMTQLARAVRRAPRGPVRADRDVRRLRHGRRGDLGEPAAGRAAYVTTRDRAQFPGRGRHQGPGPVRRGARRWPARSR